MRKGSSPLAETLYLLIFLTAVAALLSWAIGGELRRRGRKDAPPPVDDGTPFALRDPEDFRKRHGDRRPF